MAFRIGGDEFALLLPETGREETEAAAERVREAIAGVDARVSTSVGLATWPVDGRSAAELYRAADRRLYSGKQRGRNQLVSADIPTELLLDKFDVRL